MTVISRLELDHPPLAAAGGSALEAQVQALYQKIGDHMSGRFFTHLSLANSAFVDFEHNFSNGGAGIDITQYRWALYDFTGSVMGSRFQAADGFTVADTPSFVGTRTRVTNTSGSTKNIALVLSHVGRSGPFFIDDTTNWNGSATTVTYDVTALGEDARQAVWSLKDAANNYAQILADIDHTDSKHVRVTVGVPLAAGTYRLVGVY